MIAKRSLYFCPEWYGPVFFFSYTSPSYFPASEHAVVTGVVPSPPPGSCLQFIAHRVQQSSIIHRVLLAHALALSASQFVHKKKSPRIHTSMHSGGLEFKKLTYTRLEDNLTRHRGDRLIAYQVPAAAATTTYVPVTSTSTSSPSEQHHQQWRRQRRRRWRRRPC